MESSSQTAQGERCLMRLERPRDALVGVLVAVVGVCVTPDYDPDHGCQAAGWPMNARRSVRDHERLPQHSEARLTWALITVVIKRLTREEPAHGWKRKPPANR
ncbi:hypothetical protein GCM10010266_64970 [Streptomyces griseomycini]|nr:hypothetical protein GCM10010266_64970 [Streptomyces griseomycini]